MGIKWNGERVEERVQRNGAHRREEGESEEQGERSLGEEDQRERWGERQTEIQRKGLRDRQRF